MARSSFVLATAMLFAAVLAVASALPMAERERSLSVAEREKDDHSDHDHSGHDHSGGMDCNDGRDHTGHPECEGKTSGGAKTAEKDKKSAKKDGKDDDHSDHDHGDHSGHDHSNSSKEKEKEGDKKKESSPSPSPSPTSGSGSNSNDDNACFPADARVELEDGSSIAMDQLAIGDSVKVGVNEYSKVFMFTHRLSTIKHEFVVLKTTSGASLTLTKGHYIYTDGSLVAASEVKVGSSVSLGDGKLDTVISVGSVTGQGLYNPQTVNGNVVVNNILASTYTTAVEPVFAHAVLSPFRFLHAIGFQSTALESGGGKLADLAPRGSVL